MTSVLVALAMALASPSAVPGAVYLEEVWETRLPEWFTGSDATWLLATERSVYVAGQELDVETGGTRRAVLRPWHRRGKVIPAPDELEHVEVDDGQVFLLAHFYDRREFGPKEMESRRTSENNRALIVMDERTGRQRWRLDGQLELQLAVGERIVLVLRDGRMTALDRSTGKVRWAEAETASYLSEGGALSGGVVAIESSRGESGDTKVRGLSTASGRPLWETALSGTPFTPPVAGRDAFFTSREKCIVNDRPQCDTTVYALDQGRGQVRWRTTFAGERVRSPPEVRDGRVVVVTDVAVHALSEQTGKALWRHTAVANFVTIDSRPTFAGADILLWAREGGGRQDSAVSLLALDVATGAIRWSWTPRESPSTLSRPFLVGRDLVYADGASVHRMRPARAAPGTTPSSD